MKNKQLIKQFELLIEQIKFDIDFSTGTEQLTHMYRLNAIQTVLDIIKKYPEEITDASQLKGIKGVGKGTLRRVNEILTTGRLSEVKLDRDRETYLGIVDELEKVFGIGRRKAYELVKENNITSIQQLKESYEAGKITLTPTIVKGLKYVDKIKESIPRSEVDQINEILANAVVQIDPQLFGRVCGSYRRQKSKSNDVDFVLVHTNIKTKRDQEKSPNYIERLVTLLKEQNIIVESLTEDNVKSKYMGIYHLPNNKTLRRLDIRYVPYESYYAALLYFTGSGEFNKRMRQHAINLGYMLNEYGLFDRDKKMFKVKSEKEIFDKLNMDYIPPHLRD